MVGGVCPRSLGVPWRSLRLANGLLGFFFVRYGFAFGDFVVRATSSAVGRDGYEGLGLLKTTLGTC